MKLDAEASEAFAQVIKKLVKDECVARPRPCVAPLFYDFVHANYREILGDPSALRKDDIASYCILQICIENESFQPHFRKTLRTLMTLERRHFTRCAKSMQQRHIICMRYFGC